MNNYNTNNTNDDTNDEEKGSTIAWYGYPSPRMTSTDLLAVIESTAMVVNTNITPTTKTKTNKQTSFSSSYTNRKDDDRGVTIANLALVLDLDPIEVQAMVEELQLDGLIYENEQGSFVPL